MDPLFAGVPGAVARNPAADTARRPARRSLGRHRSPGRPQDPPWAPRRTWAAWRWPAGSWSSASQREPTANCSWWLAAPWSSDSLGCSTTSTGLPVDPSGLPGRRGDRAVDRGDSSGGVRCHMDRPAAHGPVGGRRHQCVQLHRQHGRDRRRRGRRLGAGHRRDRQPQRRLPGHVALARHRGRRARLPALQLPAGPDLPRRRGVDAAGVPGRRTHPEVGPAGGAVGASRALHRAAGRRAAVRPVRRRDRPAPRRPADLAGQHRPHVAPDGCHAGAPAAMCCCTRSRRSSRALPSPTWCTSSRCRRDRRGSRVRGGVAGVAVDLPPHARSAVAVDPLLADEPKPLHLEASGRACRREPAARRRGP